MTSHYAHPSEGSTGLPIRCFLLALLLLIAKTSYGAWDALPELWLMAGKR